jgi:C_GCAxxG_C_C family probable redox protein
MARTGGMCGALSGGILAIGLIIGRDSGDNSIEPTYTRVRTLITLFREQHGSTSCPDLIECDLSTEEGQLEFKQKCRIEQCRRYVKDATQITMELV